jgi:hypothetical protein
VRDDCAKMQGVNLKHFVKETDRGETLHSTVAGSKNVLTKFKDLLKLRQWRVSEKYSWEFFHYIFFPPKCNEAWQCHVDVLLSCFSVGSRFRFIPFNGYLFSVFSFMRFFAVYSVPYQMLHIY